MRKFSRMFVLAAGLVASTAALAHQSNISTSHVKTTDSGQVSASIVLRAADIDRVSNTRVGRSGLPAQSDQVLRYVLNHVSVDDGTSRACRRTAADIRANGEDAEIDIQWDCGERKQDLIYRSTLLFDGDSAASQIVTINEDDDEDAEVVLDRRHTSVVLSARPSRLEAFARYLGLGVGHILTGYDHICFLLAIILWGRKLWPQIKIVSAFTISHSITLSLAALGIVVLPQSLTEPAISATIIMVAGVNFLSNSSQGRALEAFLFGLVHGFGFASALAETGLPRGMRLSALAGFNLGVEAGQVLIIGGALPILIGIDRVLRAGTDHAQVYEQRRSGFVLGCSAVIICFGLYWLVTRIIMGMA